MNNERNIGRDSIDESMEEEIFSTEMRLHDREKFLLNKVSKQLVRLDANEIDVCEDCGEAISFRRLMARPVSTLCIDCKEQAEREEAAVAQNGRGAITDADMGGESEKLPVDIEDRKSTRGLALRGLPRLTSTPARRSRSDVAIVGAAPGGIAAAV